ncbi:Ankyrin repeat domain containing protein [Pandoravirus neocaledonia]|uniref:Ankyrin repeat domain containing protein n=1 Tax=Pandoravirus neocaledonia TaxID=2107708 RepID=A0A2U7UBG3_9VIRU|nr:Ankyrin repeat domain containing protein [Pandoravirus neocaledonia]AVK75808.1 Ankyrin repeat domain containing protein [Pandoravirus neocaledonia]
MPRRRRSSRCVRRWRAGSVTPSEHDHRYRACMGLGDLPAEMVDAILSELTDPRDVARCRMASRVFWTRENCPRDRYPESACPCSRRLRMPMPRSRHDCDTPYPGHGFTCYASAIAHALARCLVDEAEWLWGRFLSALCVPRPFDKSQRCIFPYTRALEYTAERAWYAATEHGDITAVRWAHGALTSVGLHAKPSDHYYGAAARGHADVVMWLLNAGLLQDTWGAAQCAAKGGHLDLTRALLGARRRTHDGRLYDGVWASAARGGHTDVAMTLLREYGVGFKRATPPKVCNILDVDMAVSTGMIDALALLWQKHGGAEYEDDAVSEAIRARRTNVLEWLASMGAQLDGAEIASACPCRGHGERGPAFDCWRRSRYGFAVSCIAIQCAFNNGDASALQSMGIRKIRPHIQCRCRCDLEIDWRRLLGDLFHQADNPNAPTPKNKEAVAALGRRDSDVSRMAVIMAQACPRVCVAAGWLTVAVGAANKALTEALLPHADARAAYSAARKACEAGDRRLFAHLAALSTGYGSLHITLQEARGAPMAAFLIDSGAVHEPSGYTLAETVSRGCAPVVKVVVARMTRSAKRLRRTRAELSRSPLDQLLVRAVESRSTDTVDVLLECALAPYFHIDSYHEAIDTAGRRGFLSIIARLSDAARALDRRPDPQIVARALVCARLAHDDDHAATAEALSTEEIDVMRLLADGATVPMQDYHTMRLDTCIKIARLIRRWPPLATTKLVGQLVSSGVHAAWLEQLYVTRADLFQGAQRIETLVTAAVEARASDIVRWLCRRCRPAPSFAAQTALVAVRQCDVATAQCLLIDGKGASACEYDDLVAAAASATCATVTEETSTSKDRWRAYMAYVLNTDEKAAANHLRTVDADLAAAPFVPRRESKARAWVTSWADTCWRPAPTGIEPTGACHLSPTP